MWYLNSIASLSDRSYISSSEKNNRLTVGYNLFQINTDSKLKICKRQNTEQVLFEMINKKGLCSAKFHKRTKFNLCSLTS